MKKFICFSFLILALLPSCKTLPPEEFVPGEKAEVVIVNPTSDEYPESTKLWEELIQSHSPGAGVISFAHDAKKDEVLSAVEKLRGEQNIFIFQGHGGKGKGSLNGDDLDWNDVITTLVNKQNPFVLIIDSCFSGSASSSFVSLTRNFPSDALLITSSGEDEQSYSVLRSPESSTSWLQRSLLLSGKIPSVIESLDGEYSQHPEVWFHDGTNFTTNRVELEEVTEFKVNEKNRKFI